jgi:hypothetical protein
MIYAARLTAPDGSTAIVHRGCVREGEPWEGEDVFPMRCVRCKRLLTAQSAPIPLPGGDPIE